MNNRKLHMKYKKVCIITLLFACVLAGCDTLYHKNVTVTPSHSLSTKTQLSEQDIEQILTSISSVSQSHDFINDEKTTSIINKKNIAETRLCTYIRETKSGGGRLYIIAFLTPSLSVQITIGAFNTSDRQTVDNIFSAINEELEASGLLILEEERKKEFGLLKEGEGRI